MKIFAAIFAAVLLAGCRDASVVPAPEPPAPVRVAGVAMDRQALEMTVGDREFLVAELTPEDADNQVVKWSSSDETVATVDSSGEVNAVAEGEAKIGVRTLDGGFEAFCVVTVEASGDKPGDPDNPDNPNPDDPGADDPDNPGVDDPDDPGADDPGDPADNPGVDDPEESPLAGETGTLKWSLDAASGTLTVSGSGDLPDWPDNTDTRSNTRTAAGPGRSASAGTRAAGEFRSAARAAGMSTGNTSAGAARAAETNDVPPWNAHRAKIVTLVLPSAIGRVGANNFVGCENLTSVEIAATTPPRLGSGNFDAQYYDTLIVPKASAALYRDHPAWRDAFGTITGRE